MMKRQVDTIANGTGKRLVTVAIPDNQAGEDAVRHVANMINEANVGDGLLILPRPAQLPDDIINHACAQFVLLLTNLVEQQTAMNAAIEKKKEFTRGN